MLQVRYNTELEDKLPSFIMRRVDKTEWTVYPNCSQFHIMNVNEFDY